MLTVQPWTLPRKILFRFLFVYIILSIEPWTWLAFIPGLSSLVDLYFQGLDWVVSLFNDRLFHIGKISLVFNGSGDTTYGWALEGFLLIAASVSSLIWSIIDRRRLHYHTLNYWLCLFTRYYLALHAFSYGMLKVLHIQMPFPLLSEMATAVGDLLPMRLSWLFIGYSSEYQMFSGLAECFVALLLLYRRTATLGVLLAVGVFLNVVMLNLSYDIPVKLFAMRLFFLSLFLLANEWKRLWCFFVLHKPAGQCTLYEFIYNKPWMRWTRLGLKLLMVYAIIIQPYFSLIDYYKTSKRIKNHGIDAGIYDVAEFKINNKIIPDVAEDTSRWRQMIFEAKAIENIGIGSLKTADSGFYSRYNRKYFLYEKDSSQNAINFFHYKSRGRGEPFFTMQYAKPDTNTLILWGKRSNDSLHVLLRKTNHHFQLAERQFHWLSESNR